VLIISVTNLSPIHRESKISNATVVSDGVSLLKLSTMHGYIPEWCNWWNGKLPLACRVQFFFAKLNRPSLRFAMLLVTQIYRKRV